MAREAWAMIKGLLDVEFLILTKRIDRFKVSSPSDWNNGDDNVNIGRTAKTQETAAHRLPPLLSYPIKRRLIAGSPLWEAIDVIAYLGGVEHVTDSGESGREDREWVLDIRRQCRSALVKR